MIKFHLSIALLCSQCAENVNPIIGICACCYNRSLIIVLCFAISFRGYILSSFPWLVNMRLQSSCLLVTTIVCTIVFWTAIQFCLWLLLLLIDYCRKGGAIGYSWLDGLFRTPWSGVQTPQVLGFSGLRVVEPLIGGSNPYGAGVIPCGRGLGLHMSNQGTPCCRFPA
jgi:hypothetical protein